MVWKVNWTEGAWTDLENVAGYIAVDSPHYAAAFVREVKEAVSSLKRFAERGRMVPEFRRKDIRELFVRHFRLIYQITKSDIYVLALVHGARDLQAFLGQKF